MKKPSITIIFLLIISSLIGAVYFKVYTSKEKSTGIYQQDSKGQTEQSKYDVGSPDPQELLELVNKERRRINVAPLQYDDNVARAAQIKSDHMVANGYFDHIIPGTNYTAGPEMMKLLDLSCRRSGGRENLYQWRGDSSATSRMVFDGWMSSDGHRSAIQDSRVTHTGFSITDGKTVVQLFCVSK